MITTELVWFEDRKIRLKHPKGMRKKHSRTPGEYFFMRPVVRTSAGDLLEWLDITVDPPADLLDAFEQGISNPVLCDNEALRVTLLARGRSDVRPKAREIAVRHLRVPSGVVEYRWSIVFDLEGHVISVTILSPGEFAEDRAYWLEVICSIELLH